MSTAAGSAPVSPAASVAIETARVLLVAAVTGFALGVGDLWAKANLQPAHAALINSSEGWALAVLLLGFLLRTGPGYAALAGAVMLLVAVEAYYVCEPGVLTPDLAAWNSDSAQYWAVIGVPAGLVFGTWGAWVRIAVHQVRELFAPSRPSPSE